MDKDFLLKMYCVQFGPEAGPWNLGVVNKYLEYRITAFFEENFLVRPDTNLCNIGIGAGYWDRYLSYQLTGGKLTSIDIDEQCCRQLREGLSWEENPNPVEVICADVMTLHMQDEFQIVTLVGSTLRESGQGIALLEKAMHMVASGGELYLQILDATLELQPLTEVAERQGMTLTRWECEEKYGLTCGYYRFSK